MKKSAIHIFILPLIVLTMTACELGNNWFIHPVSYNDKEDKPQMVVTSFLEAGKAPKIYVNESIFFLDPNHNENDTIVVENGLYTYSYIDTHIRYNYITDADVIMTVNGGTPVRLEGSMQMDTILTHGTYYTAEYVKPAFSYTTDYVLQPGDNVEITVSHPKYEETAHTKQHIPNQPQYQVENVQLDSLNPYYGFVTYTLRLLPYSGDPSDMLVFSGNTQFGPQTRHFVYSKDLSFEGYDKTNNRLSNGYYGSNSLGIYRAVNQTEEVIKVSLLFQGGDKPDYAQLTVQAVTRDHYLYTASMIAAEYYHAIVLNFDVNGGGDNIVDEIQDLFDEMGSMEGIQIYNNVEHAIGHVTATTACPPYRYQP